MVEIKRVRRITLFWGNDLTTVHVAAVCIALLVSDNSLYAKSMTLFHIKQKYLRISAFIVVKIIIFAIK